MFILFFVAAFVAGCGQPRESGTEYRVLTDGVGNSIRIPIHPDRIATLAPGVTEMVIAAGGLDHIVGVSTADNFPEGITDLPSYSALPVNFEAIAALHPDVVFGVDQVNDVRDIAVFNRIGIPAYYFGSRSIDDVLDSIETIAEILGTEAYATAVIDSLRNRIDEIESRSAHLTKPDVLFLISSSTLHSFGPESYIHELVTLVGGRSITEVVTVDNPILSDEFVLTNAPDVIVGTFGPEFTLSELLEHHPTWSLVPAVQNGRVYTIDGDLILRAGPRIVDGAEQIFKLLHPNDPR